MNCRAWVDSNPPLLGGVRGMADGQERKRVGHATLNVSKLVPMSFGLDIAGGAEQMRMSGSKQR